MGKFPRVFDCATNKHGDCIKIGIISRLGVRIGVQSKLFKHVLLDQETCKHLIAQLQCYVDTGKLLPEDPPEVTDEAKEQVKALLAAVGVECDPEQLRVIQDD